MRRRGIAGYTKAEFDALRQRLERARDTLRCDGQLLQSVARAYYVVYVLASFAAGKYGVKATHARSGEIVIDQDFSHNELPDVVYALYTGGKRGTITDPGGSPGIGSGNYDDRGAYRNTRTLYLMRLEADYGGKLLVEPYPTAKVDEWLTMAKNLAQDLETIL